MDEVVQTLRSHDALIWAWRIIAWGAAGYLLVLGGLMLVRPAIVLRFFEGFASSWSVNFLEACLRTIVGLGFIGVSPDTKLPMAFLWVGVILVATSIPLIFLHKLHKRQETWVMPLVKRILPLMGVVALALGALMGWALS